MESGPTLVPDPNDDHGAPPAVRDFLVEMSIREMELPHIVLSQEAGGGCVCFSGPYPTAMEALVAADIEASIEADCDPEERLTFGVAAIYPNMNINIAAD